MAQYVYDGWTVIAVLNQAGQLLESYTRGNGLVGDIGTIVAETKYSGGMPTNTYYYHNNHRGDITTVRTETNTVASYDYYPYGGTRSTNGSYATRFRFSSKEWDESVNLYYYGYRFYSQRLGRWLMQDPIGERGGFNLYSYGPNSPLNGFDPLGVDWISPNPNWPPIKPAPRTPGSGAVLAAALLAAIEQAAQDAMSRCDGPCVKASRCQACCNRATYIALGAALGAASLGNAECFKLINPFIIGACIAGVDYVYKRTTDDILEAQSKCLSACNNNPL